jgi:serine/threonine-protein kinase
LCPSCEQQASGQPQTVAGYRMIRELGRGSVGVVHLAVHVADRALLAVKTIIPAVAGTQADVDRFLREADILRRLDHPRVVAFRDVGGSPDRLYFAMDYVPGIDAGRLVREQGPLAPGRAVGLVCQLLEGLAYAHGRGFVHRDVKPANMLVTEREGRETVKLADFGLARAYEASRLSGLTLQGDLGGTIAFVAPEQITSLREAKPPVDQYAAAASLYYLLTKRTIHDLPPRLERQIALILTGEPVPIRQRRRDIPGPLADVIHRALAREPGDRFPDVEAMRAALAAFA